MKKLVILAVAVMSLGFGSFAVANPVSFDNQLVAQRGCCSHHNGVAGCKSNGTVRCNDGTTSPTCGC